MSIDSLPLDVMMAHILPCLQANEVKKMVLSNKPNALLAEMTRVGYTHTCSTNESVQLDTQQWFQQHHLHLIEYHHHQSNLVTYHAHFHNGMLHRTDGCPAFRISRVIQRDRQNQWQPLFLDDLYYFQHGLLHATNQPAHICFYDYTDIICQEWYIHGKRHRTDPTQPAIINEANAFHHHRFDIMREATSFFIRNDHDDNTDQLDWNQPFTAHYQHGIHMTCI